MTLTRVRAAIAAAFLVVAMVASGPASAQSRPASTPGRFDYYVLALSWSPTYCADPRNAERDQAQCGASRRFAFVVHGLWPQNEVGWPADCPTSAPGPTPALTQQMLDIMPSPRLVQHEWRRHGACSGLSAQAYFDLTRKLRASVATPPAFAAPDRTYLVTAADVRNHFLAANKRLKADQMAVVCRDGRMQDVRICLAKDGSPRTCGRDVRDRCEGQARMPPARPGR